MDLEEATIRVVTTSRGLAMKSGEAPQGLAQEDESARALLFEGLVKGADGIWRPEPERKALPLWPPDARGGRSLPILDQRAQGTPDPNPVIWLLDPSTGKATMHPIKMRPDNHLGGVED